MADRQFTYKVNVDTASAQAAAKKVRGIFEKEMVVKQSAAESQQLVGIERVKQAANRTNRDRLVAEEKIRQAKARTIEVELVGIERIKRAQAAAANQEELLIQRRMRTAQMQQEGGRRGGVGNTWSQIDHILKTGFLAYGAAVSAKYITQGAIEFGQTGAQQMRTMETFENLGQRIGVNAEDMAAAVKKASNSSISDMQAMQLSANVLAQRFAGNIDDIAGDTAILASASRRLAQIYTDENGELLSTEQVFSRLIKFAREGNKELVDQFGLSNELIAETLGIPNEGLRGAEGAANRWRGMIMVLQEELERLGEPADSLADRYEIAFAEMRTSLDKLRQEAAEPIVITVEWIAGGISNFATGLEGIRAIKESQELWEKSQTETSPALDMVQDSLGVLNNALATGKMEFPEYAANVMLVVDAYHKMEDAAIRAAAQMEALRLNSARLTAEDFTSAISPEGAATFRMKRVLAGEIAPADLTEAEREYRMAVGDNAERIRILQAAVDDAKVGTDEWKAAMFALTGAQADLAGDIDTVKGRFLDLQTDIQQYQLSMRLGAAANDVERVAILRGLGLSDTTAEGRKNELEIAQLERSIAEDNARLAEEAQREWKQTAKEVERMFESAADKIMGIPGITSLTPVTEQEMLAAKYGVYQEQPDEWVRRVRDELLNNVDYANVSREQVAGLTGLSGDLPSDVLINRLEGMWTSGSLFADPANLGLMNMDAIRERYNDMLAGQQGRANQRNYIMSQLGISSADAALLTGQQAPIVQMLTGGMSEGEVGTQLQNSLTGPFGDAISKLDFAQPMISNWTGQLNSEDGQNGLKGLGKIAAAGFFAGFNEGIGSSGFATAIIVAIKTDIAKSLADMANAN